MKKLLVRLARQSPAMIVAMLALFVALTGTAVATTSALIGSAQIRNNSITGLDVKNRSLRPIDFRGSVRGPRGLRGLTGATGAAGAAGAQGAQGIQGIQGPEGPFPNTLPAGKTIRGSYYLLGVATAAGQYQNESISYMYAFAVSPARHYITEGSAPPAGCPGTNANPQADPGHLCIYEGDTNGVTASRGIDSNSLVTGRFGVALYTTSDAAGDFWTLGTWAATGNAPAAVAAQQAGASPSSG